MPSPRPRHESPDGAIRGVDRDRLSRPSRRSVLSFAEAAARLVPFPTKGGVREEKSTRCLGGHRVGPSTAIA
jgi:hypothetical protein